MITLQEVLSSQPKPYACMVKNEDRYNMLKDLGFKMTTTYRGARHYNISEGLYSENKDWYIDNIDYNVIEFSDLFFNKTNSGQIHCKYLIELLKQRNVI